MKETVFTSILVLASILSSSSACIITNRVSNCNYTVQCNHLIDNVSLLECHHNPQVSFIISQPNQRKTFERLISLPLEFKSAVREFKGVNNSWPEIKPDIFYHFRYCYRFDLSNNKIEKIHAFAFLFSFNMRYLNLSHNDIESFDKESFLISDNLILGHVKELDVSYNRLQFLGVELKQVPFLTKLYLQNNLLSSIAEDAFFYLKNLSHLYLQHNLLTSVNSSLQYLRSLTTLDLSNNRLMFIAGDEINCLVAIVNLNLSHNELTSLESNYFRQSFDLQKVDFSFNKIRMNIDKHLFINNSKLNYLDFSNNDITGIEEKAFHPCNLSYLNLENNNIIGNLTDKILSNLQKITELNLFRQNITGIWNYAFADMGDLIHLNLSNNNIVYVGTYSFVHTQITVLDLSHNQIPNLYFLRNSLTSLTELYLNNNNITVISKYIFDDKIHMRILDLSMNKIIRIAEYSLPLYNLKFLNLSSNYLTELQQGSVQDLLKTEILDFSKNSLTKLNISIFNNFNELKLLSFDYNRIKTFDTDRFTFISLKKLRVLSLVGNLLSCHNIVYDRKPENFTHHFLGHDEVIVQGWAGNFHNIKCGHILNTTDTVAVFINTTEPSVTTAISNIANIENVTSLFSTTGLELTTTFSDRTDLENVTSYFYKTKPEVTTAFSNDTNIKGIKNSSSAIKPEVMRFYSNRSNMENDTSSFYNMMSVVSKAFSNNTNVQDTTHFSRAINPDVTTVSSNSTSVEDTTSFWSTTKPNVTPTIPNITNMKSTTSVSYNSKPNATTATSNSTYMNPTFFFNTTKPKSFTSSSNITTTESYFVKINNATVSEDTSVLDITTTEVFTNREHNSSQNELQTIRDEFVQLQSTFANLTTAMRIYSEKMDALFDNNVLKDRIDGEKNSNTDIDTAGIKTVDEKIFMHIQFSLDAKLQANTRLQSLINGRH